jgi:hypothetical protein
LMQMFVLPMSALMVSILDLPKGRSQRVGSATSGKCNEWEVQRLNSLLEKI